MTEDEKRAETIAKAVMEFEEENRIKIDKPDPVHIGVYKFGEGYSDSANWGTGFACTDPDTGGA